MTLRCYTYMRTRRVTIHAGLGSSKTDMAHVHVRQWILFVHLISAYDCNLPLGVPISPTRQHHVQTVFWASSALHAILPQRILPSGDLHSDSALRCC
jgi:hypothetical protein